MKILKYVFFVLILAIFSFFLFYKFNVSQKKSLKADKVFVIEKGESLDSISKKLKKENLIKYPLFFKIYAKNSKKDASLQAGSYLIKGDVSMVDLINLFASGKAIKQEKEIKIIEGWDIQEINDYLKKEKIQKNDDFLNLAQKNINFWQNKFDYPFLRLLPKQANLEGFLFPDTYRIYNNADVDDIIAKMLANFNSKLSPEILTDIKKQNKSLYEIITMASIIQKEVRSTEDMKIVSGIFWNRIKNKQALQSCATLAYILGEDKAQYSLEDTKIKSPYNTYQNRGLPPGPICNPGLEAIKAAVYPEETDYNYFLSSFKDGKTIFSKTYAEHLRNKEKYLK